MISSKEIRQLDLAVTQNGYNTKEVDSVLSECALTIDAYQKENEELYRKMELLAAKIEEYRLEENAIKTALVTAEKMAEKIKKESTTKRLNCLKRASRRLILLFQVQRQRQIKSYQAQENIPLHS